MAGRGFARAAFRPLGIVALLLAALVIAEPLLAPAPAFAQESDQRFWLLRKLFAPRKAERLEPRREEPSKRKEKRTTQRQPAEPPVVAVQKLPEAKVVLVASDFLASGLAEGLTAVFAENPGVRVVDRSSGSSGFVRNDVVDWPVAIRDMVAEEKPAAVVIMLGSNDRQQMRVGDKREAALSEPWLKEYGARTGALGQAVADMKVPMLWVGMPAFKFAKMNSDMLVFNDIYRTAAEAAKGEFVDIWDGFVDENGAYAASGPDINGQPVRLRSNDGINMTRAGKRKMAFYVEKPLNRILGVAPGAGVAALVPALPDALTPIDPASIDRTQPIALSDPELDGGVELLGGSAVPSATNGSVGERLLGKAAASAVPGRVDDFAWPPRPAVAGTVAPAETATAIAR